MSKNRRGVWCPVLAAGLVFVSGAAEYHLTTNAPKADNTNAFNPANYSYWTDLATGAAATQAITAEDVCWVYGSAQANVGSTFPVTAAALHIGNADGTVAGDLCLPTAKPQLPPLVWHAGKIHNGAGGSMVTIASPTVTLDTAGAHNLCFLTAAPTSSEAGWSIGFTGALSAADADTVLHVILTTDAKEDAYSKTTHARIDAVGFLAGDNSGFRGKILVDTFGTLALGHVHAAGDPGTARADAVELGNHGRLTVYSSVQPNTARGVRITGDDVQIHAREYTAAKANKLNCRTARLTMPVTGTKGFTKKGDGTLVLSDYSAGDIDVAEGELVFPAGGTFAGNLTVTVRAGAVFTQNVWVPGLTVTCEEGGTHNLNITFDVPYDAETGVSAPLDRTAGFDPPLPAVVRLTAPVALPLHDGARIDLLKLAPDSALTTADFLDGTAKTYGLPKCSFEMETRDDCKMLVLVARPVVVSVANFPDTDSNGTSSRGSLNGTTETWSDGAAGHAGADYLLTNKVDGLRWAFRGDSVTMASPSGTRQIMLRNSPVYVGDAIVYPGIWFYPNTGNPFFRFSGTMHIPSDGTDGEVYFHARWADGAKIPISVDLNLNLTGDGNIRMTSVNNTARDVLISGDNSAFKGRVAAGLTPDANATAIAACTARNSTRILFTSPAALGGALEKFRADALYLKDYAVITPTNQTAVTLATSGRGITIDRGGFDIPGGVTLTVGQPVRVERALYKRGEGELVLAAGVTIGNNVQLNVLEGTVRAGSDAAVDGLPFCFWPGAGITVTPDAAAVNGFTGELTVSDGEGKIRVTATGLEKGGSYALPVCTRPADAADLTPLLEAAPVPGFVGRIAAVEVDGAAYVRYTAHYTPAYTLLIIR